MRSVPGHRVRRGGGWQALNLAAGVVPACGRSVRPVHLLAGTVLCRRASGPDPCLQRFAAQRMAGGVAGRRVDDSQAGHGDAGDCRRHERCSCDLLRDLHWGLTCLVRPQRFAGKPRLAVIGRDVAVVVGVIHERWTSHGAGSPGVRQIELPRQVRSVLRAAGCESSHIPGIAALATGRQAAAASGARQTRRRNRPGQRSRPRADPTAGQSAR